MGMLVDVAKGLMETKEDPPYSILLINAHAADRGGILQKSSITHITRESRGGR